MERADTKHVPRASSSLVAFWALAGFAAVLLGDAAIRSDWHLVSVAIAPAGFVVWAAWLFLYRPEIRFDADRVIVVNPGRTIEVPWSHVTRVEQRPQLVLELGGGVRITCWGAPFPDKAGLHRPATSSTTAGRRAPSARRDVVGVLESARRVASERTPVAAGSGMGTSAEPSEPVGRRWDVAPLVVGAILFALSALALALLR
jgi:hypothetical protein